jgi:hypothetical protein
MVASHATPPNLLYLLLSLSKRLTKDRPDLSSERAPPKDRTVNLKKKISGQKSQIGLDTKTY